MSPDAVLAALPTWLGKERTMMTETKAIYYAEHVETVEEPVLPTRLLVGGYPVLLADHCELVDRMAALEARIAQLEAGAVRVIDAKLLGY